jgi:hypothetical protein
MLRFLRSGHFPGRKREAFLEALQPKMWLATCRALRLSLARQVGAE